MIEKIFFGEFLTSLSQSAQSCALGLESTDSSTELSTGCVDNLPQPKINELANVYESFWSFDRYVSFL